MGESDMDKRIIDQISQMVLEELRNENSLTATATDRDWETFSFFF